MTFIEEGNKDFINNLINFRKRELISDIIDEIQLYQQLPFKFEPNQKISSLLYQLPHLETDRLYQLSLLREPRNAERTDII